MKKMHFPWLILIFWLGFNASASAQGASLYKEAIKTELVEIVHPQFTLKLEKFDKSGLQGLSRSSGPEFTQVGGNLYQIMEDIFGPYQYEFSQHVTKANYFLTLKHPGQERTPEFLDLVLNTWIEDGSFNLEKEEILMRKTCIRIEDRTKLKTAEYQPEKGVFKRSVYKRGIIELTGYSIEEIAGRISYETKESYAIDETGVRDQLYEVKINLKNSNTIRESLAKIGLKPYSCEQMTTLIKIPDNKQVSLLDVQ